MIKTPSKPNLKKYKTNTYQILIINEYFKYKYK